MLGRFKLSYLLLVQDSNYPWFILVPDREGLTEIYQLSVEDQIQLTKESADLSSALKKQFVADKLNIAALGNIVSQLHVHHISRYQNDPVWPAPVWGKLPARPYTARQQEEVIAKIKLGLKDNVEFYV